MFNLKKMTYILNILNWLKIYNTCLQEHLYKCKIIRVYKKEEI